MFVFDEIIIALAFLGYGIIVAKLNDVEPCIIRLSRECEADTTSPRQFPIRFNRLQSSELKKMAAVRLTKIPCELNTAHRHIESHIFGEIRPCTNNIVYERKCDVIYFFRCVC